LTLTYLLILFSNNSINSTTYHIHSQQHTKQPLSSYIRYLLNYLFTQYT